MSPAGISQARRLGRCGREGTGVVVCCVVTYSLWCGGGEHTSGESTVLVQPNYREVATQLDVVLADLREDALGKGTQTEIMMTRTCASRARSTPRGTVSGAHTRSPS